MYFEPVAAPRQTPVVITHVRPVVSVESRNNGTRQARVRIDIVPARPSGVIVKPDATPMPLVAASTPAARPTRFEAQNRAAMWAATTTPMVEMTTTTPRAASHAARLCTSVVPRWPPGASPNPTLPACAPVTVFAASTIAWTTPCISYCNEG